MRTDSRVYAFKYVFADLFKANLDKDEDLNILNEEQPLNDKDLVFAKEIIGVYNQNKQEIQNLVEAALQGYQIDRVFKADLALIYVAIAEYKFMETPKPIVANEILEISKKYSTEKSSGFINGVIAKVN